MYRMLAVRLAGIAHRTRIFVALACAIVVGAVLFHGAAPAAVTQTTTYTATETFPIPPASDFAGSGGGDGWAVALSSTQVFNVFHHQSTLTVACHEQSDASACWTPRTITDADGNNFASQAQPAMYLDQATGKLYVYATRTNDATGGVVCIDTTVADTSSDPFCGFTALTAPGEAPLGSNSDSAIGSPALIGSHWYAFNFVSGSDRTGAEDHMLCFDVSTDAACAGQPFADDVSAGAVLTTGYPAAASAAIGNQLVVPITVAGSDELTCFDGSTETACAGAAWPVSLSFSYAAVYGAPFPLLDADGAVTGFCLPTGTDPCYTQQGASTATPAGMASVIPADTPWNGPAFVLGPRIYVPNGNSETVACFDYSTDATCANFPKTLSNLDYLYSVNPDPQRPTCIWVNADGGAAQIQNFDAYTGAACGQGATRVLTSQFVVSQQKCNPVAYQSVQLIAPARSAYKTGSVAFEDGDGNPIPGAPDSALNSTGTASLSGLGLESAPGLPQFLFTLTGAGSVGQVVVKLTWTATYDPDCVGPGITTAQVPTTTKTSLSGGGQSAAQVTVPSGTAITDVATISGDHAASASGKVTYSVYSDSACTRRVALGAGTPITTPGSVPASAAATLTAAGTYYWMAVYSGDSANFGSQDSCGDEVETVTAAPTPTTPTPTTPTPTTSTPTPTVSPPANLTLPSISGTPLPTKTLTCAPGAWTSDPTHYTYQWSDDGTPIAGATASTYTVQILDEANTLTCTVTAINAGGSASATSPGDLVAVKGTLTCQRPSGSVSGLHVGVFALGMTRPLARRKNRRYQVTHNDFDNFCLYAGFGIRVGYPSHRLRSTLSAGQVRATRNRIVLALTANPYYRLDGVQPGTLLATAAARLKVGTPFHVGHNYWYFLPGTPALGVFKVQHGEILEVGLATKTLTGSRAALKRFINSFRAG